MSKELLTIEDFKWMVEAVPNMQRIMRLMDWDETIEEWQGRHLLTAGRKVRPSPGLVIEGTSDDLVSLTGGGWSDESGAYGGTTLLTSTGHVIRVGWYDREGAPSLAWTISLLQGNPDSVVIEKFKDEEDGELEFERLTFSVPVEWIVNIDDTWNHNLLCAEGDNNE